MSNAPLSKEQQSAYQRWEMNSFGDNRASSKPATPAASNKVSIEEAAKIREDAQIKGYAEGLAEGRATGLQQGMAQAAEELAHLRRIAEQLGIEVQNADEVIAQDILNLALDLSKAMLKTSLNVRPELVLPIVGEAIRYLPSLQQPALLFLHPTDAAVVKSHMQDELTKAGWRVVEDTQIQRGGCRVETASNQVDATISTRWQRLAEALGKESEWLEPL